MKTAFFVFGIKRSGNHAIINWLYKMIPNYVHLNNLNPKFLTHAHYNANLVTDASKVTVNYKDNAWLPFTQNHTLLISFEDHDIKQVNEKVIDFCNKCKLEPTTIMIIRDPKNMLASLFKIKKRFDILPNFKNIWMKYADEYLHRSCIQHFIVYDKWFTNVEYRKKIATDMKLEFDDSNHNKIFKHGVSSFDGYRYQNDTTKMDVLNRADFFKDNKQFDTLISDPKMLSLWTQIMNN